MGVLAPGNRDVQSLEGHRYRLTSRAGPVFPSGDPGLPGETRSLFISENVSKPRSMYIFFSSIFFYPLGVSF